ncbi:endoplasmic reticulum-Golgi intermediate compartment protein 3 [Cocos nucifera]|uniref:Endoplasmic reticulum-Golgi intermediate compartment protein 3 n=1 Tax=Cocos nucifera TaxID=13894 RepID=A0A8K0NAN4_COCNU|nr:endoplasmic reticulum-Golgi intermediate compartment protein 3 [Cocos nucifera]
MEALLGKLRSLDAYPKINEDFYSRTLSGGIITIVSSIVMFLLFISELRLYLHAVTETKLVVDTSRGETLRINRHDVIKTRIDSHGNVIEARQDGIGAAKIEKPLQRHGGRLEHNETYCGSCYGAETSDEDCCNSCEEVREAYRKKGWGLSNPDLIDQCKREGFLQRIKDEEGEGCNIYGFLEVNKVAGNFHFAPGKSFQQSNMHVHDLLPFQKDSFNVVPTVYTDISGRTIQSNQFSVTEHFKGDDVGRIQSLPGVFFFYDLSPIKVTFTEEHVSFLHFLTNVCAIVGGIMISHSRYSYNHPTQEVLCNLRISGLILWD